ncbi:MAG: Rieske 2Fe-2S domain-containing protein [Gammaproteobacteria bacterium]|nr:Rieske 2Fe-2S domain-containing protein [Gammaproteobacteria bacterium]MDD9874354.1 Rieske 2Fe-2S domain-containing protein [Gammaproteobacteria bacterium]
MSWKTACAAADVPAHSIKACEVDGVEILVANVGDGFRAYPPVCPHMEEYLEDSGICSNGVLTCTKHLWQWDMKTGEARPPAEKPLLLYEVKQEDGKVMVYLDKELEYAFDHDDDDDGDD